MAAMSAIEIIGVAASVSLLAGWRLYLAIFAVGVAMRTGWVALPEQLAALDALARTYASETINTSVGGAVLALALVDPGDPAWQVVVFLLGGGASLMTHGAKATTRAAVNTSPEPFSNVAVSTLEDVATGGLLVLALANPVAAVVIAIVVALAAVAVLVLMWRIARRLLRRQPSPQPPPSTPL